MASIYILCEDEQRQKGETLAHHFQHGGHQVYLKFVSHFPIADTLSSLFATIRTSQDIGLVCISQLSRQSMWVLRELVTSRQMTADAHNTCLLLAVFVDDMQIPSWMPKEAYIDGRHLTNDASVYNELYAMMHYQS
jgi:hypothetical protein